MKQLVGRAKNLVSEVFDLKSCTNVHVKLGVVNRQLSVSLGGRGGTYIVVSGFTV